MKKRRRERRAAQERTQEDMTPEEAKAFLAQASELVLQETETDRRGKRAVETMRLAKELLASYGVVLK